MANDLSKNTWVLDTAEAVIDRRVYVKRVRWVSKGASAGDDMLLSDKNGGVVMETAATGANYAEESTKEQYFNGLTLTTLDSGTVYVDVGAY